LFAKLTICLLQLLSQQFKNQTGPWGGCTLTGIPLSGGRHLGNLGSIILCGLGIAMASFLIIKSDKKKAAVGRRYVLPPIASHAWDDRANGVAVRFNYSYSAIS
jgi:hypothetical protein